LIRGAMLENYESVYLLLQKGATTLTLSDLVEQSLARASTTSPSYKWLLLVEKELEKRGEMKDGESTRKRSGPSMVITNK
jgi:hypothetical protein